MIALNTFETMKQIRSYEEIIEVNVRAISDIIAELSALSGMPGYPYSFKGGKFEVIFGMNKELKELTAYPHCMHMYATGAKMHPPVVLASSFNLVNNSLFIGRTELPVWFYKNLNEAVQKWINLVKVNEEDIFNDDLTKWRIITRSLNMQLETIRKAAEGIEELFNK